MPNKLKSFIALFTLSSAVALPAMALERGTQLTVTDATLGKELVSAVENAAWATDGSNARKPVYVIYGTDCPISKDLYERSRGSNKVQLRWIAASGANAAYVSDRRDAASVGKSFGGGGSVSDAAKAQRLADYNDMIPSSLSYLLRELDASEKFAYPTLVYRTPRGVKVVSGTPDNLAALASEVLDQPGKATTTPVALSLTAAPVKASPSRNLKSWGPDEGTAVFRMAPSHQAAPVFDLDSEHTMAVTGIVAEGGWLQTTVGGRKAYTHAPLAARMALLDYQAKPASGQMKIRQPVAVHEFPHQESRVLKQAKAGDSYRRTGTVELDGLTWNQVAYYKDGTPGFILQ